MSRYNFTVEIFKNKKNSFMFCTLWCVKCHSLSVCNGIKRKYKKENTGNVLVNRKSVTFKRNKIVIVVFQLVL